MSSRTLIKTAVYTTAALALSLSLVTPVAARPQREVAQPVRKAQAPTAVALSADFWRQVISMALGCGDPVRPRGGCEIDPDGHVHCSIVVIP
ncbi:MAG TPA: hypothetical protein VMM92_04985 [Thermoanaerobaculia bacterium]|nr:hypothetical protein [Thermoanaerobaculia bacterium]